MSDRVWYPSSAKFTCDECPAAHPGVYGPVALGGSLTCEKPDCATVELVRKTWKQPVETTATQKGGQE
jgi:hypothetical protein